MPIVPTRPPLLPGPFAYNGDKNTIPDTGADAGAASWSSGFPPVTQLPLTAGGIPPQRNDFNGVLNAYGVLLSFIQTGALFEWSDELTYPFPCLVVGSDNTIYVWLSPSGVDTEAGAKDPVLEANLNYWISLSSFVSGDFVPDSRRVIAGTGLTGGGPLSADVTLAAKLTDSVSSTDSTTAASATAVKTAYEAAQSKLPLAGGVLSGSMQINDPANVIGSAPSTNTERGLFLADKNSVVMGGFDVIQRASDNAKYTQFYSKNSSGHITSIAAVTYEDGTRELVADSPLQINDIQIKQVVDGGRRVIVLSGARGKEGYSFRFSPDTGEAYMDGRVIHAKADTAGNADTATYANSAGSALIAAPAVQWVVNLSGPQITVPPGGTYNVVCICFNDSGGKGAVKHYPDTAGGTVIQNAPTDYMVAGLCARVQKEG